MIHLENIWKTFHEGGVRTTVAAGVTATFPTGVSVALLGRNGAGKSSMLKMIAGTMQPDRGTITTSGSVSWPVGFAGSFHPELSGAQNTRFIARIYGVDTNALTEFVEDFADLGRHFRLPLRTYSSGMRSRLAFGVSMGIGFDTYLVDEVTSVGDHDFKAKARDVFNDRMRNASAIVVSHSNRMLRDLCDAGMVLEHGHCTYYENIEEALIHHTWNIRNGDRHRGGTAA